MRFKGIIFDLDGTLLDTLADIAGSMNVVLEANGYPTHPREDYKQFVGEGMNQLVRNALKDISHDDTHVAMLEQQMKAIYAIHWNKESKPYEGIEKMLAGLQKYTHLPLAVLSNKPQEFTELMVNYYFRNNYFSIIRGAQAGIPNKPYPESALAIAQAWQTKPGDILFIGDSKTDMQTAINAGMYACGVLWGFRDAVELLGNGANFLLGKPSELAVFIGQE